LGSLPATHESKAQTSTQILDFFRTYDALNGGLIGKPSSPIFQSTKQTQPHLLKSRDNKTVQPESRVGCYQLQSQPAGPADRSVLCGLFHESWRCPIRNNNALLNPTKINSFDIPKSRGFSQTKPASLNTVMTQ
jgi:hypothetical protein